LEEVDFAELPADFEELSSVALNPAAWNYPIEWQPRQLEKTLPALLRLQSAPCRKTQRPGSPISQDF
jgi:hypothetical protein